MEEVFLNGIYILLLFIKKIEQINYFKMLNRQNIII